MDEDEVKTCAKRWLEKQNYKVQEEVGVLGTQREVILDFWSYKDGSVPEIIWVEAKGDTNLSELLEGFIRLKFAIYHGGGLGILALPHKTCQKLLKHKAFLKQVEKVIYLLDVERNRLIKSYHK